jgi:hypothetical protein
MGNSPHAMTREIPHWVRGFPHRSAQEQPVLHRHWQHRPAIMGVIPRFFGSFNF